MLHTAVSFARFEATKWTPARFRPPLQVRRQPYMDGGPKDEWIYSWRTWPIPSADCGGGVIIQVRNCLCYNHVHVNGDNYARRDCRRSPYPPQRMCVIYWPSILTPVHCLVVDCSAASWPYCQLHSKCRTVIWSVKYILGERGNELQRRGTEEDQLSKSERTKQASYVCAKYNSTFW